MILPDKFTKVEESLIGIGGGLLSLFEDEILLSILWDKAKEQSIVTSFERYIQTLDLLYILGAIEENKGSIVRVNHDT